MAFRRRPGSGRGSTPTPTPAPPVAPPPKNGKKNGNGKKVQFKRLRPTGVFAPGVGKGTRVVAKTGGIGPLPEGPTKPADLRRGFRDIEGVDIRRTLMEVTAEGKRRNDMDMMKGTQTPAKRTHFLVANNFFNYLPRCWKWRTATRIPAPSGLEKILGSSSARLNSAPPPSRRSGLPLRLRRPAIDGQVYTNRKRYCKRGMVGGPMY